MDLYLNNKLNGYNTRNKVVRSMDIAHAPDYQTAYENYCREWFSSTKKQYLTQAFKLIAENRYLFWPKKALTEMLEEIYVANTDYDDKELGTDIDILKSKYLSWATNKKQRQYTNEDILKEIKKFERKYKYECPDSFKFYWLNNGAFITLQYTIKYEKLFSGNPKQNLDVITTKALEISESHNHDLEDKMLELVYNIYKQNMMII